MFVKKFLAFILGAAFASAWWQASFFKYPASDIHGGLQWFVAAVVTLVTVIIVAYNCSIHLRDK